MGSIITISALKSRRDSIIKAVIFVPIGILVCGVISSVTIFSYLSHFCVEAGFDINDPGLTLSGPELSFSVLPKALALLPLPNMWIFVFFIAMVLLGIDSQFGLIEGIYTYMRDEFK